jgi:hypothetical protein
MKTLAQVKEQLTWRRRCWQKARVCISSRNKDGAGRRRDFAADADARSGAEKTGRCSITRLLGLRENGSFGSSNKLTKTIFKFVLFVRSCRCLKTLSSLAVGHGNTRSLGVAQRTIYHQRLSALGAAHCCALGNCRIRGTTIPRISDGKLRPKVARLNMVRNELGVLA